MWGRLNAEMNSGELNLLSGKRERGDGHVILYLRISFLMNDFLRVFFSAIIALLLLKSKIPKLKLAYCLTSWIRFQCSKCVSILRSRFRV